MYINKVVQKDTSIIIHANCQENQIDTSLVESANTSKHLTN